MVWLVCGFICLTRENGDFGMDSGPGLGSGFDNIGRLEFRNGFEWPIGGREKGCPGLERLN